MKKVQLIESFVSEGFEVHYSDGVRAAKKFKSEKDAMSFTKEKIASGKCKEIAIYKDGAGFHSTADTEAVVAWWGDGSYLDNVSKKDSKLAAKKIDESVVTEATKFKSTKNFIDFCEEIEGMPEAAIKKIMGKEYIDTPGGWADEKDDYDDIEDYMISNMGRKGFEELQDWWEANVAESVVTEAKAKGLDWVISELGDKPKCYAVASFVYDNYDKVTGLRKSMRNDEMDFPEEIMDVVDHYGLDIDEFTDCYGMAAESVVTEGVVSIKGGRIIAHKVLNKLVDMGLIPVRKKSEELLETIAEVITNAKMESVEVNEGAISDIHIMAQEAKDFKSFVKEFTKSHHDLSKAGEPGQFEAWLKSIYDDAKESMDESVVNEGDMTKDYDGFVVLDTKAKKSYKFKYIKGSKSVNVENDAIAKLMKSTGESRGTFMVNGFVKKGEWDKSDFEVLESVVTEAIKPAGLSKAETKKVAETYAKAISKHDGCKCTVNAKSLEEDSFDLDIDGEEYAGGSYYITLDGDVINAALPEKPVYGQIDSTVDEIIKNLKK
jgi:hypothetical protein